MVNYQGDLYIRQDGARYDITKYPHSMDSFRALETTYEQSRIPPFGTRELPKLTHQSQSMMG